MHLLLAVIEVRFLVDHRDREENLTFALVREFKGARHRSIHHVNFAKLRDLLEHL